MIKDFLSVEGPVFGLLDKIGELILLSVMWLLGCIPIVTLGTSTTALYYAVIKSVRRGRGSAAKEFWSCYRKNLGRGILVTVLTLIAGGLLVVNIGLLRETGGGLFVGSVVLMLVLSGSWIYLGPVLSRFTMKAFEAWLLAFTMSIRFLNFTVLLLAGLGAVIALQIYILPAPMLLLVPGIWCYAATFLIEKALRRYMPEKKENDDAWYYES